MEVTVDDTEILLGFFKIRGLQCLQESFHCGVPRLELIILSWALPAVSP